MSETLYPYYERELHFLRQLAQEFARQYPAAAGRLLLEPTRSVDPHVERLLEAFALLAARVHHKIDDEFPELTEALFSVLYPHYLAPVPSLATVQFDLDATRGPLPDGFAIPKGSRLLTQPLRDTRCRYRTCYPVTLWPVALTSARLLPPPFPSGLTPPPRAAAALVLKLECQSGLKFSELSLERLRFHLFAPSALSGSLYELVLNHARQVVLRSPDAPNAPAVVLTPGDCLHPVGFGPDEGLLPYPDRSFVGYRLLTEYFAFPQKFLYFDLGGFARARAAGFGRQVEVVIFCDRTQDSLEQTVDASLFRLGCTPAVNLFEQTAEPIQLTQTRHEYRIVPDVARPDGLEVFSVDSVTSTDPTRGTTTEYQPFYALRHAEGRDAPRTFWYAGRRAATRENDRGSDVFLNLVDLDFNPRVPAEATLIVRTTCTNRNLPAQLQRFGDALALELEAAAPLQRIRCLRAPTLPLRPPRRRGAHWRLVSHLNLNHLSLTDPVEGKEALQEILRLYDFSDPETEKQQAATARQVIDGIASLRSRRVVGKVGDFAEIGYVRGVEVTVEFDEQKYVDTGVFLFASVLERFLGLYASINSFSQMVARTKQGEGVLKRWPPRAGDQPLL